MKDQRRSLLKIAATGSAGAALWTLGLNVARAQTAEGVLPESARVLVGYPPRWRHRPIARCLADGLSGKLARAVITENRPSAAGRIAVDIAMQSPPDGYTLLLCLAGVLTINPHTNS